MAKQYWVGEFFVDLTRNQISQNDHVQTLPPKALQVLTELATHQGQVVSYEMLLDAVWPNSVVTPNTLQRSIAQLRKALGENSKAQSLIKTHAKQGYSLECEVNWSVKPIHAANDKAKNKPKNSSKNSVQQAAIANASVSSLSIDAPQEEGVLPPVKRPTTKFTWFIALLVAVFLMLVLPITPINTDSLRFSDFRYLTATDDKEYGAIYTPDGKYIIFQRYLNQICVNNLWAKNAQTLEETQLTAIQGTYSRHSLSPNGEKLVFIEQTDCTKPISQDICYTLMQLDFKKALQSQQTPEPLLHCQNSAISRPKWIDNEHISLLQKEQQAWRLVSYSTETQQRETLYEVKGGNILYYAYSAARNVFVLTVIKENGLQYVDLVSPSGQTLSSQRVNIPEHLPRQLLATPSFTPNDDLYLFGFGGQLYTLTDDGDVNVATTPFDMSVGAPYFHPNGQRMLLIKGRYDSDFAELDLSVKTDEQPLQVADAERALTVLKRTFEMEDLGKFQPNGEQIAYVSEQTGVEQVWLYDDSGSAQLISHFSKGNFIRNIFWDAIGENVLVLANQELFIVPLVGEMTTVEYSYPITDLFHWDSTQQRAIASVLIRGVKTFVEIDLQTLSHKEISRRQVFWAAQTQEAGLVYMDEYHQFWQQGALEDKPITALNAQGSAKRFVLQGPVIYGINRDDMLWSYDLTSGEFTQLAELPSRVDNLTDIRDQQVLLSLLVAEKKEVIEVDVAQ